MNRFFSLSAAILACLALSLNAQVPVPAAHNIKTVFLIIMENHNWVGGNDAIKNNPNAPYINGALRLESSYAQSYFNPSAVHPSLPNYLWLEAGTDFGISTTGTPATLDQKTHEHLTYLLDRAGISWRAYDERNLDGTHCPYQYWHTAFVFFDDETDGNNPNSPNCIAHDRPFAQMYNDLKNDTTARYNFISPTLCHSMHSVCNGVNEIKAGDEFLAQIVPKILASPAYKQDGVLFIVWDEAESGDGPVPLFVLSPFAKGNGYSNAQLYTHSSTLRTIEEIFGVTPLLGDAASHPDLSNLFLTFP